MGKNAKLKLTKKRRGTSRLWYRTLTGAVCDSNKRDFIFPHLFVALINEEVKYSLLVTKITWKLINTLLFTTNFAVAVNCYHTSTIGSQLNSCSKSLTLLWAVIPRSVGATLFHALWQHYNNNICQHILWRLENS